MKATPEEIAWAAGLFEGEGSVSLKHDKRGNPAPVLSLGMTDQDTVEKFAAIIGVNQPHRFTPGPSHYKDMYRWQTQSIAVFRQVMEQFWPYLSYRRRQKFLEVYTATRHVEVHHKDRMHCARGHEFTPENTHVVPSGARHCRTCRRANGARYRAKKKGADLCPLR